MQRYMPGLCAHMSGTYTVLLRPLQPWQALFLCKDSDFLGGQCSSCGYSFGLWPALFTQTQKHFLIYSEVVYCSKTYILGNFQNI